jgi:hypothetical protein
MRVADEPTELVVRDPATLAQMVELLEPDDFEQPLPLVLANDIPVTYFHRVVHYDSAGGYILEGWFERDGIERDCRLHQQPDGPLLIRYYELLP